MKFSTSIPKQFADGSDFDIDFSRTVFCINKHNHVYKLCDRNFHAHLL